MARFQFHLPAVLLSTLLLWNATPELQAHGGGHHGCGHGGYGHHGFGYGHHGFGYGGFGLGGFGLGGFGYGGFGYPGFGYGGFGYPGFGYGGLGYGGFGYGGLGYGGLGYGGLGYGGFGYGGMGFGGRGYGGFGRGGVGCGCCCTGPVVVPAGPFPPVGVPAPAAVPAAPNPSYGPPPVPSSVSSQSRYGDYYARAGRPANALAARPAVASAYRDYYVSQATTENTRKARLLLQVPANAVVLLNGQRMSTTGQERVYLSPKLEAGETYAYEIQVTWTRDGQQRKESREVTVRADQTTTVRFDEASLVQR